MWDKISSSLVSMGEKSVLRIQTETIWFVHGLDKGEEMELSKAYDWEVGLECLMVEVNRNSGILGSKAKIMVLYMYARLEKPERHSDRNAW